MPKNVDRMHRIQDLIHRTVANLLREEFKDPRIGLVTVMSVDVSRDLSFAKVYVTVLEEDKIKETLAVLNKASGFFRSALAKTSHLRLVPKLKFEYDESVMRGARIDSLLHADSKNAGLNSDSKNTDKDKK